MSEKLDYKVHLSVPNYADEKERLKRQTTLYRKQKNLLTQEAKISMIDAIKIQASQLRMTKQYLTPRF